MHKILNISRASGRELSYSRNRGKRRDFPQAKNTTYSPLYNGDSDIPSGLTELPHCDWTLYHKAIQSIDGLYTTRKFLVSREKNFVFRKYRNRKIIRFEYSQSFEIFYPGSGQEQFLAHVMRQLMKRLVFFGAVLGLGVDPILPCLITAVHVIPLASHQILQEDFFQFRRIPQFPRLLIKKFGRSFGETVWILEIHFAIRQRLF